VKQWQHCIVSCAAKIELALTSLDSYLPPPRHVFLLDDDELRSLLVLYLCNRPHKWNGFPVMRSVYRVSSLLCSKSIAQARSASHALWQLSYSVSHALWQHNLQAVASTVATQLQRYLAAIGVSSSSWLVAGKCSLNRTICGVISIFNGREG
jgi:hypothetical protein